MFFNRKRLKKHTKILFVLFIFLIAASLIITSIGGIIGGTAPTLDNNQGLTQEEVEQYFQEQISALEKTAQEEPENAEVLSELATMYMLTGEGEKAKTSFQDLVALQPENTDARLNLASLYLYEGGYDQAEEHVAYVLEKDEDNIDARHMYGYILAYGKEDYQGAITQMEKFIELVGEGPYVEQAQQLIEEWQQQMEEEDK
ncbi:tetratricopeptide repeat protein [Desulfofalx alkaliphila]|uniref:tetratricopeptide repeat protein n=1 Tax=Desulfofalx alkaliphila TaxID=105483 RepID=UPI0004E2728E|nr:tetratricopeptide repeat protein [Desulfofalx alkaliphila]